MRQFRFWKWTFVWANGWQPRYDEDGEIYMFVRPLRMKIRISETTSTTVG